jgi:glucose-1-phosphate thymidylyltransferase
MKGILLAGGSGTRLSPLTSVISKQLLPIYDKPAIYYPLATLMLAGIKDIAIISTPRDLGLIEQLLGDGKRLGMKFTYIVQARPEGIAQAFLLAEEFLGGDPCCLILGDNFFYGNELPDLLKMAVTHQKGARVFAYRVSDPQNFGVVTFDAQSRAIDIQEKPKSPKSPWAVTGLYFYDEHVVDYVKKLAPSARGELEITDLNRTYLGLGQLEVSQMGRGMAWLDMGTPDSVLTTSQFVQVLEKRQGLKIACIEEIAFLKSFIGRSEIDRLIAENPNSAYYQYLRTIG